MTELVALLADEEPKGAERKVELRMVELSYAHCCCRDVVVRLCRQVFNVSSGMSYRLWL